MSFFACVVFSHARSLSFYLLSSEFTCWGTVSVSALWNISRCLVSIGNFQEINFCDLKMQIAWTKRTFVKCKPRSDECFNYNVCVKTFTFLAALIEGGADFDVNCRQNRIKWVLCIACRTELKTHTCLIRNRLEFCRSGCRHLAWELIRVGKSKSN